MKKILIATSLSGLFFAAPAFALSIYSPYVEKGVVEIESKNRFDNGGFRQHQVAVEYGFTSQWKAALYGELEKESGHGYKYTATEIENIFQLTEVGEYQVDVGALVAYEFKHEQGSADKVEAFLLLAKNYQKYTVLANIGIEQEIGSHANSNPEGEIKLAAKYNYLPNLNPGLEYYGSFGEITGSDGYDEQSHLFGPALYGKLGKGVSYDVGTLFGISRSAPDFVLKVNLEYEFPI